MVGVVEENGWVYGFSTESYLEMQVRSGGASCLSGEADNLACLDFLPGFYEVL